MNNTDKKTSIWDILIWIVWIIVMITALCFLIFIWYYYSNTTRESDYCRKDDLKKELKIKISNGADLEVLENVFAYRHKNSTDAREWNYQLEKDYYDSATTLLQVLKDLRSDYFDTPPYLTTRDTAYYSRLSMIIAEYTQKAPFDGLDEGQLALFINLQKGLGDDYDRVEEKITSIADELGSKNALVNKYLNNSNDSYRLSRFAFFATIVFGVATIVFGVFGLIENIRSRKERRASNL